MNHKNFSLARYLAIQAFYQLKQSQLSFDEVLGQFNEWHIENISFDFNNSYDHLTFDVNKKYFNDILIKYKNDKIMINSLIDENLIDTWKSDRLPKVLYSIIRVAVTEMVLNRKLSFAIIASEYIILTETFFSKKESSFVNALLENIYKKFSK